MLTNAQILWASQHDWFLADRGDGTIEIRDDETGESVTWIGTFVELRAWAGY